MSLSRKFLIVSLMMTGLSLHPGKAFAAPFAKDIVLPDAGQTVGASTAASDTISKGAFEFVQKTAERGLTFLSDPGSSKDQKKKEFRKLLDNSFDLETIGRFALGRYWNVASPAEKKEYQSLFRKMVVEMYANRFDEYKGQKFEAKTFRSIGNNDTLVTSVITPANGGADVQVDWRVRSKGGSYKIVDVLVAGVSMSVTQRSDFASVIQSGGGKVSVLIDYLRNGKQTASN
jgi:phospholipid transport system substrate-binding protein